MKHIALASMLLLVSCSDRSDLNDPTYKGDLDYAPKDLTKEYKLHQDLADCKVYSIRAPANGSGVYAPDLYIMRCPDSKTTTETHNKWTQAVSAN